MNKISQNTSNPAPEIIGLPVRKLFQNDPLNDQSLVSQYIRSIFQDSKGNLWFGTIGEGVVRYDTKTLRYFNVKDNFNANSVFAINEDKKGNMWFGTEQGVYKYDPSAELIAGREIFKNYKESSGLSKVTVSRKSILVDKAGNIWIGTSGGVFQYNPFADTLGGKPFSVFPLLAAINVSDILEDKAGNIWFATHNNGVFKYSPDKVGEKITNFSEKVELGENYAGGMIQDKAGNIWFTMKYGISRYDRKTFTDFTSKDGLGGTEFWGICQENSGIIWVTARGRTTRFDPSLSKTDPKAFTAFTPNDRLNCCVQSMYQDKSGNMWWGTGQGLYRFDGKRFYQVKLTGPW